MRRRLRSFSPLDLMVMGGGAQAYWEKVLNTQAANLIGFWRLNETSGSTAVDSSPEGNDGAYVGVDLANAAGPDGVSVPFWDGSGDYMNFYSAAFNTDFNGQLFSVLLWYKVNSAAVYTDGASRRLIFIGVNASNYFFMDRLPANNEMAHVYNAGGTIRTAGETGITDTGWVALVATVSLAENEYKFYRRPLGGALSLVDTETTLGTWAGALHGDRCLIGASAKTPSGVWHGWIGPVAIWKTKLSPTEVDAVTSV